MEIKLYKWGWRFYATAALRRVRVVRGRNSRLADGCHILMWDFDNVPCPDVIKALETIQADRGLPDIHIVSTGKEGGYHAYCFDRRCWTEARAIVAETRDVDKNYLAIAIGREYFTLRYSDMPDRGFTHVTTLFSAVPDKVEANEVVSRVDYTRRV